MKLAAARAKLEELLGPLQVQEIQERLRQLQQPRPEGTISTPGGGTAGLTFQGGKYGVQPLQSGMDKETVKQKILKAAETAPKESKATLQFFADALDAGADPQKVLDEAGKFLGQSATHQTVTGRLVKGDPVPDKNSVTGYSRPMYDGLGNFVKTIPNIVIPGLMPKEVQGWKVVKDDETGEITLVPETTVSKPVPPGQTPPAQRGPHVIGHTTTTQQKDAIKASAAARDVYGTYQTALKEADDVKIRKNPKASLGLVFNAVRSMVAGAGRMTNVEIEQELKAGSYEQRFERWYQQALTGTLPDDQVDQIIGQITDAYQGKRMAGKAAWDFAYPGKPTPPWLREQQQQQQQNVPPPPKGYVMEKPGATP